MHSRPQTLATLAACAALVPTAAACGGSESTTSAGADANQPSTDLSQEAATQIVGGRTVLKLDPTVRRVFDAAGVKLSPVGQAKAVAGGIELPIVTGRLDVDTPSGTIQHDGGIRFSAAGHELTATNLLIRPGKGRVTARVDGRRVPLLETSLGDIKVDEATNTIVVPSKAKVGQGLVEGLNDAAGTKVLDGGLTLGRLATEAERGE